MEYETTSQPSPLGTPYPRLREAGKAPALLEAVTGRLEIRSVWPANSRPGPSMSSATGFARSPWLRIRMRSCWTCGRSRRRSTTRLRSVGADRSPAAGARTAGRHDSIAGSTLGNTPRFRSSTTAALRGVAQRWTNGYHGRPSRRGGADLPEATMSNRREFLKRALAAGFVVGSGTLRASDRRRVFVAGFSHETNTFHPVKTTSFGFAEVSRNPLPVWKDAGLTVVPGVQAHPNGGGTIDEKPCREAMNRVLDSLRAAMPVDAVFLRLHGAMYAEGIGPAETVLVGEVRSLVGPKIPIACTFDLHGNIPARLAQFGDILVGLKTAPHTDGAQTADLAGRILLDTLAGKVHPVSYVLPIPMMLPGREGDDDRRAVPIAGRGGPANRARRRARPRGEDPGGHALRRLRLDGFAGHGHVRHGHRRRLAGRCAGGRGASRPQGLGGTSPVRLRLRDRRTGGGRQSGAGGQGIDGLPDRQRRQRDGQHARRPADRAAPPGREEGQERRRRRHQRHAGREPLLRGGRRARDCASRSARRSRSGSDRRWRPRPRSCA